MVHAMMIDSCNACTLYKIVQVLLLNVHSKIIDCFRTLVDTSYMYYSATTIKPHQHEVFGYKNTPREYKYYYTVIYVVTSDVRLLHAHMGLKNVVSNGIARVQQMDRHSREPLRLVLRLSFGHPLN